MHLLLCLMSYQHTRSARTNSCWPNWTLAFRGRCRCNLFCHIFFSYMSVWCFALICSHCSHVPFHFSIINLHWPFSPPHIAVWPAVLWVVWRCVSMGTASILFRFCRLTVYVIKGRRFWMKYSWILWQSGGVSGSFSWFSL